MEWKKQFSDQNLERGKVYYQNHRVKLLDASKKHMKALVQGENTYLVRMNVTADGHMDMNCTCPAAKDTSQCKHMAAALFAWDEVRDQIETEEPFENDENLILSDCDYLGDIEKKKEILHTLIAKTDETIVRNCLEEILMNDTKWARRFLILANPKKTIDFQRYRDQIDDITYRYTKYDGMVTYQDVSDYIGELYDLIDNDGHLLLQMKQYDTAFQLSHYLMHYISELTMDDSGESQMLTDRIYQFWLELLAVVDDSFKRMMFEWFVSHRKGYVIDYLEDYINRILTEEFNDDQFTEKKESWHTRF